jgi:hypothetical protein
MYRGRAARFFDGVLAVRKAKKNQQRQEGSGRWNAHLRLRFDII